MHSNPASRFRAERHKKTRKAQKMAPLAYFRERVSRTRGSQKWEIQQVRIQLCKAHLTFKELIRNSVTIDHLAADSCRIGRCDWLRYRASKRIFAAGLTGFAAFRHD
jgi:hypothetical protein